MIKKLHHESIFRNQTNVINLQNVYILMGKPKSNFHLGLLAGIGMIIAIDGTIYFKAISVFILL